MNIRPFIERLWAFGCLPLMCAVAVRAAEDPHRAVYLKTLEQHGIEPSTAGARKYLHDLIPSANQQAESAALIAQLADDDYARREAATVQLLRMPAVPIDALNIAAQRGDAETRWRARLILERAEQQSAHVMLAALKIVAAEPDAGTARDVLAMLPLCRRPYLLDAAHEALHKTSGPNDVEVLRERLAGDDPRLRAAAVIGLSGALAPDHLAELRPLLADRDERVALEAARALANAGDRAALAALVRLLDSGDAHIRSEVAFLLVGLTGENHGYAAYYSAQDRLAAVGRWRKWLNEKGAAAQLKFPVERNSSARGNLHGNTLIATGSARRVFEMTPSNETVFSYEIDSWSAEKLSSGNVLIASYSQNLVVEVDMAGKDVWKMDSISAMTAKPLHGGNYLIADFSGRRVLEVSREGKRTVWEHKTPAECFDADRLPNGNTIVGCPNLVQEITPDHEVVRSWDIPGRLNGFQALPNGNIIVANYGTNKVYELTPPPESKTLWELDESQPCDVFLLPDGNMLVSTAARIIEVGPDRKTIREICKAQYGSARR
jgi:hypothetical protein